MKYRYTPDQLAKMADNPWLTDREKKVFDLHYRRGWYQIDVAAELDMSLRTVCSDLDSIRRKSGF